MKGLQAEEDSRTYRVRGGRAVLDWWGSLTAEGRGELLAGLLASGVAVKGLPAMTEGPSAPASAEGLERLALGTAPPDLKLTRYQREIVSAVRDGSTLTRQPKGPWVLCHTAGNADSVREDTVRNLLSLGALREG